MVYTYVLHSAKDGRWYTGVSKDLKARMHEHRTGRVRSTRSRLPVILAYYEACVDEADAWRRERYLKTGRGKRYLRKRLSGWLSQMWPIKLERHLLTEGG
ncbi:MAG: GIY-YIG nuclease family protein [Bacillati bacterium ANGP1]|uniref:GIY-YIG nuclease family protein n=1 Tax=Candidatus Segetimicrobium genomatis TaxID=2569760 RepID=A0A537L3J3_9BACT|nr:MAG: GIY-YIG nuclease family protein [Terrabacteria group bacterium ANGP1]